MLEGSDNATIDWRANETTSSEAVRQAWHRFRGTEETRARVG